MGGLTALASEALCHCGTEAAFTAIDGGVTVTATGAASSAPR
jgi:hypothetical protein